MLGWKTKIPDKFFEGYRVIFLIGNQFVLIVRHFFTTLPQVTQSEVGIDL